MRWLRARLREASTWSAFSALCLAGAFSLIADVSWWRDLVYAGAVCAVVAAVLTEGKP
jgi:hypothetical protein